MNKIILALAFILLCSFGANAQLKVVSNGDVEASKELRVGQDAGSSTAFVVVGQNRTAAGQAGFRFFAHPTTGNDFDLGMFVNTAGQARFQYEGSVRMAIDTRTATDIRFRTNNLDRMFVRANGQVDILGAATVNGGVAVTSDRRLKQNVKPYTKGLNELMQIETKSFEYNGKGGTEKGAYYIGTIAQELKEIVPEFVSNHRVETTDEEGVLLKEETFLKVHDTQLKYLMINAIQDQQAIIEEQNKTIDSLIDRLEKLENSIASQDVTIEGDDDISKLMQNVPNPFNGETQIDYKIAENFNDASISVFDMRGALIKTIDIQKAGKGQINLSALDLPSGQYSYILNVNGELIDSKKMVLTK